MILLTGYSLIPVLLSGKALYINTTVIPFIESQMFYSLFRIGLRKDVIDGEGIAQMLVRLCLYLTSNSFHRLNPESRTSSAHVRHTLIHFPKEKQRFQSLAVSTILFKCSLNLFKFAFSARSWDRNLYLIWKPFRVAILAQFFEPLSSGFLSVLL